MRYIREKGGKIKPNPSRTSYFLHTGIDMHTADTAESSPKSHECIIALLTPTKIPSVKPVLNLKDPA